MTQIIPTAPTREEEKVLNDLRIIAERSHMIGVRYGLTPPPVIFTLKSDQQVLDDLVYAGLPRHFRYWRYGQQAMGDRSGHVFEFALNSYPGEIALGSTNRLTMQARVILHAWLGHLVMDHNEIFAETEPGSVIQRFAQDEHFVDWLVEKWGFERYEWYMDAAKALEYHSGWLPGDPNILPDPEHRRMLEKQLEVLEADHTKATTDPDRAQIEEDIISVHRLLKCHPIVPTDDLLGFLEDEENTPQLPWEVHNLIRMVRAEMRYHQAFMRTRYMHEGWSNWCDSRMMWEPELDMVGLGFDHLFDTAIEGSMHERYPTHWYSDVYSFGFLLWDYVDKKHSKKIGTKIVDGYTRLKLGDDGHIVDTGIAGQSEEDVWDRSYMDEVRNTFTDRWFFETFITDESMKMLNDKALEWVRRQMGQINKLLKDRGWDPSVIFDPVPDTLEDMFYAIQVWYMQREQGAQWAQWFGLASPPFPIHEWVLQQMLEVIQTVASWDADKHAFKRQMILHTEMSPLPNIQLVDSGRFSKTGLYTLRHEFDPEFGPLRQSDARETLRRLFRFSGPCQLLTWEVLVDDWGRPAGPPRPYVYITRNGVTVTERWL